MFNIEEELKKLPDKPGVYLMHDSFDTVIYVGKAKVLKNRVRQYFQSSRNVSPKIEMMISQIARFEYIITDSEVEALVLESNLIKEYTPRYNTMLRDDKTYPFIKASVGEAYPTLRLVRSTNTLKNSSKTKYFGPYTSVTPARDMLNTAVKVFKLRTCNRVLPRDACKQRACLNYHIKQCYAPCQNLISSEDYKKNFEDALKFISGDREYCIKVLENKMLEASENLDFEDAAYYRDTIDSIKNAMINQKITEFANVNRDVIACAFEEAEAVVQVFFIREGKMIGRDNFHMNVVNENLSEDELTSQIITSFIKQFYSGTPLIPAELMLECEISDSENIVEWLSKKRGSSVNIIVPKIGKKERMVELAKKNAKIILDSDKEKFKRNEERTLGAMKEISELLGLKNLHRIESYDISHTSGFLSVGSMVVFQDGIPKKNDYRKFKIKNEKGNDDYANMDEILTRRFVHGLNDREETLKTESSFAHFPDLIMMDGGKGQVNICLEVLNKLNIDIPVCGLVKDDKHRTRGIYYNNVLMPIDTHSTGFWLITRIQDEVHRFAIEYHRSLRSKVQVKSSLDDIKGVGPKRRRAIIKYFQGIDKLKEASVEDILKVEGVDKATAENIYAYFHTD